MDSRPDIITSGATIIRVEDVKIDKSSPLGRSASVYKGSLNDQVVAVKVLSSDLPSDLVIARVALWQTTLSHPNLLHIFGVSPPEADPILIVTPCYQNVRQFLTMYPNVERPNLIFEVALGMQFLHKRGLVHGGLRPSNILINPEGHVCLSDYGMVEVQSTQNSEAYRYYSPEAWKGTVSAPSDVYSFAMSAYEIFTSAAPWGVLSEKHIYQFVAYDDGRPDRPELELCIRVGLSNQFWSIIEESWHKESRLRPSFDIIVRLWQNASADTASQEPSTLYSQNMPQPSRSTTSVSTGSGPPAYEAEIPEETPTQESSPPNSAQTARPPEISRMSSPPAQSVRRQYSYGPRPPHSAPVFPSAGPSEQYDELPVPPLQVPPRRGRGRGTSVPTTPFSPQFHVSRGSDASRHARYQSSRTPPPSAILPLPPISPSVSSSGSSNSNHPNYSLPTTPKDITSTSPVVVAPIPSPSHNTTWSPHTQRRLTGRFPQKNEVDEGRGFMSFSGDLSNALPPVSPRPRRQDSIARHESVLQWEAEQRRYAESGVMFPPDVMSIKTDSGSGGESSIGGKPSPVLLVGALQAELKEGRNRNVIDDYLAKIQFLAAQSSTDAQRLVTAGVIPTLIHLLKLRAANLEGMEILLMTLGYLAYDSISANTVYRTNTVSTLIEIFRSSSSPEILTLVCWCLNRLCRNAEIAGGLIKQNLVRLLLMKGLNGDHATPAMTAYCLGSLVHSDGIADALADLGVIQALAEFLHNMTHTEEPRIDGICSALYALARISRSIKLAKAIAKAGCVPLISLHLSHADDPQVLNWSARVVGCLMRPNSSDMAKILLDAGIAVGLARMPSVLEIVEPLSSFAFAIQRFSCAEWGSGTRKSLVEAGVVDSLLAALRTASDEPYPQVHTDLALAVSFLSDVGGSSIRKEIVNAGGIDILRKVASTASPEVARACNMAVKSTTGNLWSRNAASAKTALTHDWSGGCPEFQPGCPLVLTEDPGYESY